LHSTPIHATAAAEMRRYPGSAIAVWRTTTAPDTAGPVHRIDREQVVVVVEGSLSVTIDDTTVEARPGDAVVLPAGAARQLRNDGSIPVVTITSALPGSQATVGDGDAVTVPWSA
jgi:mannose-6-phosphate isomerase-like protein (cupin superfamily)